MSFLGDQIAFARKAADQTYDTTLAFFTDHNTPGYVAVPTASVLSSLVLVTACLVSVALGVLFRIGAEVTAIFLETLENARHSNQDALNSTIAASMSDLLSVEVTGDDIPKGGGPAAQLQRAAVIGGKLHDLLISEFGGNSGPDGVDGEKAARSFTGFNINFSVSAALLSIITEIESLGFFKEFREVGEQMAQGLSLGRLHRQALKPLIDNLIVHPYTRQLSSRYRQTRMNEAELVKAFNGGKITDDQLKRDLAEKGYTDLDIAVLVNVLGQHLSLSEADSLLRSGDIVKGQALGALQAAGFNADDAVLELRAAELKRIEQLEGQVISEAYTLAKERHMTEAEFQQVLNTHAMYEGERQIWAERLALHLAHPTKRLSVLQIVYLSERNQITLGEVSKWAEDSGYDPESQALIEMFVAGKDLDFDAVQKGKKDKAAAAAAKLAAKKPPKVPAP